MSDTYLTVAQLGSGWAAVQMERVTEDGDDYEDVYQTGIGRYKTRAEAVVEAKMWADAEEMEFRE